MLRTTSERVEAMHERARLLRHARDKTINTVLGALSFLMLTGVILTAAFYGGGLHPVENSGPLGSSLLNEGVGGYVLVGVVSFMTAVVITVLCIKWKMRKKSSEDSDHGL